MQIVTVGPKYQVVIPKEIRRKEKSLQPGVKVVVNRTREGIITIKTARETWSDRSYGFMKKYWKDTDPIAEIEKMRDEWDEK